MTAPDRVGAHDVYTAEINGDRAVVITPTVREDYPPAVREGLARRRLVMAGQTCPCGATMRAPNRATRRRAARTGERLHVTIRHSDECPATDANLNAAMAGRR